MSDCCSKVDFGVPPPATRQRRVLIAVLCINVLTFVMMVARMDAPVNAWREMRTVPSAA